MNEFDFFKINGGTEWSRNYKILSLGLGDKSEYVDFIKECISYDKQIIDLVLSELTKDDLWDILNKIDIY